MATKPYNEWNTKKKAADLIHKGILKDYPQFQALAEVTDADLVRKMRAVRAYYVENIVRSCEQNSHTGVMFALNFVESATRLILLMSPPGTATEEEKEETAQCVMVLGGAIDFGNLEGMKA